MGEPELNDVTKPLDYSILTHRDNGGYTGQIERKDAGHVVVAPSHALREILK